MTIPERVERVRKRDVVEGRDAVKGLIAGVAGGIAGAWAMNRFHALVSEVTGSEQDAVQQEGEQEPGDAQAAKRGKHSPRGEPATVLAAEAVSRRVLHHELRGQERKLAGPAMHYGFGATMGGVYGVTAEALPAIRSGGGAGYGVLVWLGADEVAVPALGLAPPPREHPASMHGSSLGAHIVFGMVAEAVRRVVRRLL